MKINRLLISNFRNISLSEIKPDPGFNIIYGANGSGKTSVLEAISYLALGRSFRGFNYNYLIKRGFNAFEIFASILENENDPEVQLGVKRQKGQDLEILINADKGKRLLDLISYICVQIIHPQGVELVTAGPELRRSYLDWGVFYQYSDFKKLYYDYRKALIQRNRLLKIQAPKAQFLPWDKLLADLSFKINNLREDYLQSLLPELKRVLKDFLPNLEFSFALNLGYPKDLDPFSALHDFLERDLALGFTYSGCHRADLKIKTSGILSSSILSRGQLKLLVCAMRLAQGTLLRKSNHSSCIFLIDDLNSELDFKSQEVLMKELIECESQVFITNIQDKISNTIPSSSKLFKIDDGVIYS